MKISVWADQFESFQGQFCDTSWIPFNLWNAKTLMRRSMPTCTHRWPLYRLHYQPLYYLVENETRIDYFMLVKVSDFDLKTYYNTTMWCDFQLHRWCYHLPLVVSPVKAPYTATPTASPTVKLLTVSFAGHNSKDFIIFHASNNLLLFLFFFLYVFQCQFHSHFLYFFTHCIFWCMLCHFYLSILLI